MLPLNFLQILFLLGFSLPAQAAPRPAAQAPTEPAVFRISGMVVDAIRHAQVMLFRENLIGGTRRTSVIRQVTTDDLGHYRFGHLAPGTYFVSVSAQPWYAQHSPRVRPNQENLNSSGTISSFSPSAQQGQALDVVYPVLFFPDANDLASAAPLALLAGDASSADFRLHAIPALHLLVRTPVTDPSQPVNIRVTQSLADGREVGLP